jgi:small-conductance mechanosensitive channel
MGLDDTLDQLVAWLASAKQSLITALPNLLTAIIVLLLGWGLARLLRRAVLGAFRRIAARLPPGLTRRAWAETVDDQRAGQLTAAGLYWLVLAGAAVIAVDALDVPLFSRWMGSLAGYLPRVAVAAVLVLGGIVAARLARNAILETTSRGAAQARNLARLTQVSIIAAAALIASGQLGLDVSLLTNVFLIGVAAALGAAALAFGLGARDVVADILAMHYVSKAYQVGQVVRIASQEGTILRTTRTSVLLESAEGELSIPGRHFANNPCVLVSEEVDRGA